MRPSDFIALCLFGLSSIAPGAALAADKVPYWASLREAKVHMRVGPGENYRIDWVYKRKDLPVKVLRRVEGWRLVEDADGARGWMLARFLSAARTGLVIGEGPAEMRDARSAAGKVMWRFKPGVTGALGSCENGWCRFDVGARKGFVAESRLWGSGNP